MTFHEALSRCIFHSVGTRKCVRARGTKCIDYSKEGNGGMLCLSGIPV